MVIPLKLHWKSTDRDLFFSLFLSFMDLGNITEVYESSPNIHLWQESRLSAAHTRMWGPSSHAVDKYVDKVWFWNKLWKLARPQRNRRRGHQTTRWCLHGWWGWFWRWSALWPRSSPLFKPAVQQSRNGFTLEKLWDSGAWKRLVLWAS